MKKIIFFLILTGCYSPIETQYKIDPLIQASLDQFYFIASSQYGKNIEHSNLIIYVESGLAQQLKCYGLTTLRSNGGQRQIEFDYQFWVESSPSIREVLTLHEFGHVFLGRVHTSKYSIMNPLMGDKGWPDNNHKILLDELFQ